MKIFYSIIVLLFFFTSELKAVSVDSTNIALIIIDTNGSSIENEPKVAGSMKIFYQGQGKMNRATDVPAYEGNVGIEIRGSFSASLPQKSYGFETRDETGSSMNVSLLGLPKENDWILLANYNDKSFVRAPIAYNTFLGMGHWASHSRHCEVIINKTYMGIYTLLEKIKTDKNRVDITKMDATSNTGNSLTGGYIFSHDNNSSGDPNWNSDQGINFIYVYPKPRNITTEQKNYLKQYISTFEKVLFGSSFNDPEFGYNSFINVTTFYDYFIIGEFSRNVDAYKKSSFWNKDNITEGGLLNAGPVWDFDWAFKNLYDGSNNCFCRNLDGSGWAYHVGTCGWKNTTADWMSQLLEDTSFANNLHHRYFELRKTVLSEDRIFAYIDSIQNLLEVPQERHYQAWPILGRSVGAPEIDDFPDTYEGEVDKLKNWILLRLDWLDNHMLGQEPDTFPNSLSKLLVSDKNFKMFPNPCQNTLYLESTQTITDVMICGVDGKIQLQKLNVNSSDYTLDVTQLVRNFYILKVRFANGEIHNKKLMIE
ncbi:MAG TPA: CotH kinase family protein [Prolixibacteraceae bacterium]|nr:CotH kinase family protein [Prolixibacteraceae bacterium]